MVMVQHSMRDVDTKDNIIHYTKLDTGDDEDDDPDDNHDSFEECWSDN